MSLREYIEYHGNEPAKWQLVHTSIAMAKERPYSSTAERADPASFSQPRLRATTANEVPFAGRIGGNQEFCVDSEDEKAALLLQKQPDAAQIITFKQSFRLDGFFVFDYYKMALIEGLGTCLLVFVLGAAGCGLTALDISPMAVALYAALVNWIGLTLFIYCTAPASGGHLNPTITMATFCAGLSSFPRSIIYIVAQSTGAIVGGYWLRLGLEEASYFPSGVIPGCTVNTDLISRGRLFVLEFMFAQALIFMAFGVGLDPRNARVYGPAMAPILVGLTLALGTLASTFVGPGYTGLSFNSARCLGLLTAKGNLGWHYLHWLATFAAAMVHGVFYHLVPPYKKDRPRREALPCLEHHDR